MVRVYGFFTSQTPCSGYTPDGLNIGNLSPFAITDRQLTIRAPMVSGDFYAPEQTPALGVENYDT